MISPHHLLLIEDDAAVAQSLRAGLEREGYTVKWLASGADGLQYARDRSPHLIILDVRLPDGLGLTLAVVGLLGADLPCWCIIIRRGQIDGRLRTHDFT